MTALTLLDNPVFTDPAPDGFAVTLTGLEVYGKPTFEQWLEQGDYLWYAKQSIQFCIGDWILYGEKAYGSKYSQAIDETRYTLHSLQNIAYTCNAIPVPARRENVSFSSHSEVASLSEVDREYALDMLQSKQWNREQVREWKRERKGDPATKKTKLVTLNPVSYYGKGNQLIVTFTDVPVDTIEWLVRVAA